MDAVELVRANQSWCQWQVVNMGRHKNGLMSSLTTFLAVYCATSVEGKMAYPMKQNAYIRVLHARYLKENKVDPKALIYEKPDFIAQKICEICGLCKFLSLAIQALI